MALARRHYSNMRQNNFTQRGQSMVEFAFLLLPFLLTTIAVIELGRAWTVKQGLTNAAREGARVLIIPFGTNRTCPDIDCSTAVSINVAAIETTRFHLNNLGISTDLSVTEITTIREVVNDDGSVTVQPLVDEPSRGEYVGIRIKYKYSSLIQGLFSGDSSTINMMGTSVMRHE